MFSVCEELEFKKYGIPVADGFTGTKKSYTLPPQDPKNQSSIGVLWGS